MQQTPDGNDTVAIGIIAAFFVLTAGAWALAGGTATAGTATGAEATLFGITPLMYIVGAGVLAGTAIYALWPRLNARPR